MSKEYTLIGGNGTVVSPLEVTEDGDYVAGDSRAFNPVKVRTGGGGSSTLSGLTDVDISNPSDGQTLVYNSATGKWENGAGGGGFTLLHATYDDNNDTISLGVTAGELYALMQTSPVFATYTKSYGEDSDTTLAIVDIAVLSVEDGVEYYGFSYLDVAVTSLAASDPVIFSTSVPK